MLMIRKEKGDGTPYARKEAYEYEGTQFEADLQNRDKVTIKDGGRIEEGQYGEQHKFVVETRNGNKRATFNQSSINVLIGAFGEESSEWKDKEVTVLTKKGTFGGKKGIAVYFVTEGWSLDEYGELVSEREDHEIETSPSQAGDIPF